MISRNFIIYGLHLICVTAITGAILVNDTCHKVWIKEDITKQTAKLNCSDTARVYDPKSQNGSYLMEDTGNWAGEIFACLCSCKLPSDPENGQILSKDRICHRETLNYSCNEDYETNIATKIVCYDGLLMTVPEYLETQNINISIRQKSLPDWFARKYDGKVFDLWVDESAHWSIPVSELQKNQKVFQLFENETSLQYYMCRGKGCMLGCVNVGMEGLNCIGSGVRDLECKRNLTETTTVDIAYVVAGVAAIVFVFVVVLVAYIHLDIKDQDSSDNKQDQTGATFQVEATQLEDVKIKGKKECQSDVVETADLLMGTKS